MERCGLTLIFNLLVCLSAANCQHRDGSRHLVALGFRSAGLRHRRAIQRLAIDIAVAALDQIFSGLQATHNAFCSKS
jgi:hypothetical protein